MPGTLGAGDIITFLHGFQASSPWKESITMMRELHGGETLWFTVFPS